MKFILNKDILTVEDKESFNSGSLKYYEIPVEKDTTWDNLSISAIIIKEGADKGTAVALINNKIYVDREYNGKYFVGFKGFIVEYNLTEDVAIDTTKTYYTRSGEEGSYIYTKVDSPVVGSISTYYEETKTYQQSTNLVAIHFVRGAGEIEVKNTEIPTQSEWEAYVSQIQDMVDGLDTRIDNLKYSDLDNDNYTVQDESYVHTDNNFTDTYKGNVDSNTTARHTHSNKSVLDGISSSDISNWNAKSDFSGSYNDLTNKPTIPDELSDLSDDSTHRLVTDTEKSTWNAKGSYSKPSGGIPKTDLESSVQTSLGKADSALQTHQNIKTINSTSLVGTGNVTVQPTLVSGTNIKTINNESILGSGNITIQGGGSTDVQINGTSIVDDNVANIVTKTDYNASTNKIATESDLPDISGKQDTIDSSHKLSADLVDDTSTTNKFTNSTEKTAWSAKYDKPSGGIPSTDLSSAVQTSLGKADTALQSETYTGTITSVKMNGSTISSSGEADLGTVITDISGKQDVIDSSHKLSADLISDGSTNKTVTATEKSTWSGKQDDLPIGTEIEIPKTTTIPTGWTEVTEVEQISKDDFFVSTTTSSTIGDFICYRSGNIINIQRMTASINITGSETSLGFIKPEYAPAIINNNSKWTRFFGSSYDNSQSKLNVMFNLGTNDNGSTFELKALSFTGSATNLYASNVTYITNPITKRIRKTS